MNIKLSIALVTRNRPESLERTLTSLYNQNIHPFELIISDDSNHKSLIKKNRILADRFGCQFYKGPQKGLYANRNFVARLCTGTHIRTMDDDHEFPENHIKACIEAIKKDPETIYTIGEYYANDDLRILPAPIPGQLHPRGYSYPPKDLSNYYGISCGATIYPRSVLDNNILNFESYQFGDLYLEYGARLVNYGYCIKPLETTYIIHHYDENNRSITDTKIINSAKIFSMLMLSFFHKKSLKHQLLTIAEITKDIFTFKYSPILFYDAYKQFTKGKQFLKYSGYKNFIKNYDPHVASH